MSDNHQTTGTPSADTETSGRMRRPSVIIFDVNETLSDMAPMAERFADVGAPSHLAKAWFACVLRDGFSLAAVGVNGSFAAIAAEELRVALVSESLNRGIEDAVQHVMEGFSGLPVHSDVPAGVGALADDGLRLVTLSNGSTSVADALFDRAGIRETSSPSFRWRTLPGGSRQPRRTPTHWSGARSAQWTPC